jgi:hypothetical protein
MHGSILHCLVSPPELRSCHAHAHLLLLCCLVRVLCCFRWLYPSQTSDPAKYRAWLAAAGGDVAALDAALMEELRAPLFPGGAG